MKKSQKEINHLKAEKDQLYKERECEIKARLAAEKLASTHKGKFLDNTPNQSQFLSVSGQFFENWDSSARTSPNS